MAKTLAESNTWQDVSTEEDSVQEESPDDLTEDLMREQINIWLDEHGSKLFALEVSKYLAKSKKTMSLKNKNRNRGSLAPNSLQLIVSLGWLGVGGYSPC